MVEHVLKQFPNRVFTNRILARRFAYFSERNGAPLVNAFVDTVSKKEYDVPGHSGKFGIKEGFFYRQTSAEAEVGKTAQPRRDHRCTE